MCYLSHIESNKMLYNQQQSRMETVAQAGMYNQPQTNFYPQHQYAAPMGYNPEYNETGMNCGAVEESEPKLSQLS